MRELNEQQLEILRLIYTFRFATSTLLTDLLQPKYRESINARLNTLYRHKLIGKHYDSSYKINRKPAVYFLLPSSFPWLRKCDDVSQKMLKRIYNDRRAENAFIKHCLNVFTINNKLCSVYGDKLTYFTASELVEGYEFFPKPHPDGFIRLNKSIRSKSKDFFLITASDDKPFFTISKKLDAYINYSKSDKWDRQSNPLPKVLFVCDTTALEKRLQKQANRIFEEKPDYLKIYTTTKELLVDMDKLDNDIWLLLSEDRKRRQSLADL